MQCTLLYFVAYKMASKVHTLWISLIQITFVLKAIMMHDNYKVLLTIIKITIPFPIALAILFFVSGHHVFKQCKDIKDKLIIIKTPIW